VTNPLDALTPSERTRRWLLAAGCFGLLIFFFSPSWAAFSYWARIPELGGMIEVRRGASVLEQVQHPGAPIADRLHGAIQWRLLFPLMGRLLHLPSWALFGLADVGCVLVFGFTISLLRRHGLGFTRAALATIVFGAGAWFFASTGWLGYYDSWVVFALLLVAFAESRTVVWCACIWAPWVEERFVLAAPLALLCRYLDRSERGLPFDWKREVTAPAALLAGFVALRLGVLGSRSAANAQPNNYLAAFDVRQAPLSRMIFGVWSGLRAGWLLVIAAVALVARRNRAQGWALGAAVLVLGLVGLLTAQDFGRSMMLVTPVAVLGAVIAARAMPPWFAKVLPLAAGAALLLPAHHVMSDRVAPIYYLYQALDAYDSPPRAVMPEVIELEAIRAMQNGDFATAEKGLTMAIQLAANPADPAKQRGVLRASQGRWKEAAEDFALMAKYEPKNPDAWFMCAQSALATGDAATAQSNLQRALDLAPDGWTSRPDVARFRARMVQGK
jgi:tetratricopeptide (TPR) repeat protein